jgi:hypothetical protein
MDAEERRIFQLATKGENTILHPRSLFLLFQCNHSTFLNNLEIGLSQGAVISYSLLCEYFVLFKQSKRKKKRLLL